MEYRAPRPKKIVKKRRERRVRLSLFIALILTIATVGVYQLIASSTFRINGVRVLGASVVPVKLVEASVATLLAGTYGGIVPHDSQFFYPREEIEETVKDISIDIKTAKVTLASGGMVSVAIKERVPVGRWCGEKISSDERKMLCRLVDEDGEVFSLAGERATTTPLYFGRLASSDRVSPIAFAGDFTTLTKVVSFVAHEGRAPLQVEVGNDITIVVRSGAKILISPKNLATAEESLRTLFRDVPFIRDHASLEGIEYIDLRFGNKVFYK